MVSGGLKRTLMLLLSSEVALIGVGRARLSGRGLLCAVGGGGGEEFVS
jgi:hypothetical protein